jgi:hypothetical protein
MTVWLELFRQARLASQEIFSWVRLPSMLLACHRRCEWNASPYGTCTEILHCIFYVMHTLAWQWLLVSKEYDKIPN